MQQLVNASGLRLLGLVVLWALLGVEAAAAAHDAGGPDADLGVTTPGQPGGHTDHGKESSH